VRWLELTGAGHAKESRSCAARFTSHFPLFSPVLLAKDGQLHGECHIGNEHYFYICHSRLLLNKYANPSVYLHCLRSYITCYLRLGLRARVSLRVPFIPSWGSFCGSSCGSSCACASGFSYSSPGALGLLLLGIACEI
jgi:hypothetical protein